MKKETLVLKIAVFLMGLPVLAICIFGLPSLAAGVAKYLGAAYLKFPILLGGYGTAIAFFFALYQAYSLLTYIDTNNAFSELSVRALSNIKYCGILISLMYCASMPLFYLIAEKDDAPGLIVVGLAMIFASAVIAVFAGVLQKLLKNAIDIKSENELTV